MQMMKKAMAVRAAQTQATLDPSRRLNSDQSMREGTDTPVNDSNTVQPAAAPSDSNERPPSVTVHPSAPVVAEPSASYPRQPWEHVDEILQTLKTTFPLLILSLETMVDQIQHKFKLSQEEDVYRNVCMLLQDAIQVIPLLVELILANQPLELCTSDEWPRR